MSQLSHSGFCALALTFLSAPTFAQSEAEYQLRLEEELYAVGAEPTYWKAVVTSDFQRLERSADQVDFLFDLKRFEAIIGDESNVRYIVEEGANRITMSQNPLTQKVFMGGEATVVTFVNRMIDAVGMSDRSETWTERVELFDGNVVPGLDPMSVEVTFELETMVEGSIVLLLMNYRSEPVSFLSEGSRVEVVYSGLGLVDADKELVYHALFQQQGQVATVGETSELAHLYFMSLLDQADQVVIPLEGTLLDRINSYGFGPRPEGPLNPDVLAANPRPAWATSVWLAGRMGSTAMGLVAEQSTNPLPITTLGSLVLADESIGYAGKIYQSYNEIETGQRTVEDGIDPARKDFKSPLERAYSSSDAPPTRLDERFTIITPETKGAVEIDEVIFGIGMGAGVAAALIESAGASSMTLSSTAAAVPAGTSMATGGVGIAGAGAAAGAAGAGISWAAVGIGAAAVGGGVVVVDAVDDDDDDGGGGGGGPGGPGNPPPTGSLTVMLNETVDAFGCFTGNVTLTGSELPEGSTIVITGTGVNETSMQWNQTSMAMVDQSGTVNLSIPILEHCPCLNGTISVTLDGAPVNFTLNGQTAPGSASSSCY